MSNEPGLLQSHLPGETESGSAGTQPDKGYPGRRCANDAQRPLIVLKIRGRFYLRPLDRLDRPIDQLQGDRMLMRGERDSPY